MICLKLASTFDDDAIFINEFFVLSVDEHQPFATIEKISSKQPKKK
jgi:hypothetical protein